MSNKIYFTNVSNFSNSSSDGYLERFGQISPIPCYILNIIAVYAVCLFVSSLFFNGLLLTVFVKHKDLRTTLNLLIMTLTILNLVGTASECPFIIVSNFNCR
jgi:hypothetical protein